MIYLPHQVCEWRGVACDKLAWVALLGVTGAARPITHEHNAASPMAGSRAAVNHREDGVHPTPYRSLRRQTHLDTTLYIPPLILLSIPGPRHLLCQGKAFQVQRWWHRLQCRLHKAAVTTVPSPDVLSGWVVCTRCP